MKYEWPWIKAKSTLDASHNHLSARRTYKTFLGFFDHTIHHRKVLGTITNIRTFFKHLSCTVSACDAHFELLFCCFETPKTWTLHAVWGAAPFSNCPKLTTICHFLFKLHAYHSWPFKIFHWIFRSCCLYFVVVAWTQGDRSWLITLNWLNIRNKFGSNPLFNVTFFKSFLFLFLNCIEMLLIVWLNIFQYFCSNRYDTF